jgi:hypothetical protein
MKPFNKENESNSGENSIIQRASSLREEISLYRNGSDEPSTNVNDNNINIQTNNIRLDDIFSTQNEIFSSPIHYIHKPLEEPDFNYMYPNSFSEFCIEDELINGILNSPPALFPVEVNNNRSDLIIENPNNNGSNIPLNNINNSNRNEFNPQNGNDNNNNNRNIMHFHLDIPLNDSYEHSFNFSSLRERTNQKEIQNINNKINKIRFKKSVLSNGSNEYCPICFEDFKNNQNVYSFPCHHLFHVHCLNKKIKFKQKFLYAELNYK